MKYGEAIRSMTNPAQLNTSLFAPDLEVSKEPSFSIQIFFILDLCILYLEMFHINYKKQTGLRTGKLLILKK